MTQEQRIFRRSGVFIAALIALGSAVFINSTAAGLRVKIADEKVSFELPAGWAATDLNAGDVLGGYATQDNRSSAFFRDFDGSVGGSMQELLDSTILNFEQRFKLTKVDEAKTGQVKGPGEKKWPAIFTTFDATVVKGRESFEMRFYLLVLDTGNRLYTLQASTTRPVREARERQIYEMIRSIVAKS